MCPFLSFTAVSPRRCSSVSTCNRPSKTIAIRMRRQSKGAIAGKHFDILFLEKFRKFSYSFCFCYCCERFSTAANGFYKFFYMAQVYDYGDETQWEEISIEGLDWLPNRIYGNQETNGCFNRVIVIHSPLHPQIREEKILENDGDMECLNPLIIEQVPGAMARRRCHRHRNGHFSSTIDHEFLYGMQLLKGCIRESGDSCVNVEKQQHSQQHSQQSASLYRRVFNVR